MGSLEIKNKALRCEKCFMLKKFTIEPNYPQTTIIKVCNCGLNRQSLISFTNILQKEDEILHLKLNMKNTKTLNKASFNNDDIISIHFISSDQNINCPIKCLRNDTFAEAEEKLYQKYQKYRETNNNFFSNGSPVIRFKKMIENNINDGDKVELIKLS